MGQSVKPCSVTDPWQELAYVCLVAKKDLIDTKNKDNYHPNETVNPFQLLNIH